MNEVGNGSSECHYRVILKFPQTAGEERLKKQNQSPQENAGIEP
jgi:hypothetical protein